MPLKRNRWLVATGLLSARAAGLHVAVNFGGGDWNRFFGAGEWILSVRAVYAFAGAGLVRRLPLMRTALVAITESTCCAASAVPRAIARNWEGLMALRREAR